MGWSDAYVKVGVQRRLNESNPKLDFDQNELELWIIRHDKPDPPEA